MIVRISGAKSGLREYFETGRMHGREKTRDELDLRVPLTGSLDLFDAAIRNDKGKGEKYLHITLSFLEDDIPHETLREIVRRFERFIFAAHLPEEYIMYAEAHLPRIKSYVGTAKGDQIMRLPHIHVAIPLYNPVTGGRIRPLGRVMHNIRWIDAWQEEINREFGLESPKDHHRIQITERSDMISRYSGVVFSGANKVFKQEVLSDILKNDITSFTPLCVYLEPRGEVRIRNPGATNEYLNIRLHGEEKGINLKEYVFSKEFLALPRKKKLSYFDSVPEAVYRGPGTPKASQPDHAALVCEWMTVRSREVRWLDASRKAEYKRYREGSLEVRESILSRRKEAYYEGLKRRGLMQSADGSVAAPASALPLDLVPNPADPREAAKARHAAELEAVQVSSRSACLARSRLEAGAEREEASNELIKEAKKGINVAVLFDELRKTHGLHPGKYAIEQGKDGSARVVCGNRRLTVADFLTKEMHLSWQQAADIICSTYAKQVLAQGVLSDAATRERWETYLKHTRTKTSERNFDKRMGRARAKVFYDQARETYYDEKSRIYADKSLSKRTRQKRLSAVRIAYLARQEELRHDSEIAARELAVAQRHSVAVTMPCPSPVTDSRKLAMSGEGPSLDPGNQFESTMMGFTAVGEIVIAVRKQKFTGLQTREALDGSIDYLRDGRLLIRDSPRKVWVFGTDEDAVEVGLRMALLKFGPNLHVVGSAEFKAQVVAVALQNRLTVRFDDPAMQTVLEDQLARQKGAVFRARTAVLSHQDESGDTQQRNNRQGEQHAGALATKRKGGVNRNSADRGR